MQISTRFTEYAITGAFFWVGQLIVFITWSYLTGEQLSWPRISLFIDMPPALSTSANNFLGALGIIGIFLAGLLLDLFGSYFIIWEMNIFRKHLERNREWLKAVIEKNASYVTDDYKDFSSKFGAPWGKQERQEAFDLFIFWNRSRRRRSIESIKRAFVRFKLIRPYNRLWSFLSSYIAVLSGSSQLGIFIDQMYLWRTSRAVSTTMVILSLEVSVMSFFLMFHYTASYDYPSSFWWFSAIQFILMIVAILITRIAYSRMCFTLFSLAYMTNEKLQIDDAAKSS